MHIALVTIFVCRDRFDISFRILAKLVCMIGIAILKVLVGANRFQKSYFSGQIYKISIAISIYPTLGNIL